MVLHTCLRRNFCKDEFFLNMFFVYYLRSFYVVKWDVCRLLWQHKPTQTAHVQIWRTPRDDTRCLCWTLRLQTLLFCWSTDGVWMFLWSLFQWRFKGKGRGMPAAMSRGSSTKLRWTEVYCNLFHGLNFTSLNSIDFKKLCRQIE